MTLNKEAEQQQTITAVQTAAEPETVSTAAEQPQAAGPAGAPADATEAAPQPTEAESAAAEPAAVETPAMPQATEPAPRPTVVGPRPLEPVEYRKLGITPPDANAQDYTGYEVLPCQCNLHSEYQAIAAVLGMCHHTSIDDIEDLNNRLLSLLADQPVEFAMSEFLKRTPEQLRDKYIREILTTDYSYRSQEEHTALAIACLRHNVLGIMALITGYLLDLPRNRPPTGVPEPDTEPDAEDEEYLRQPAAAGV